MICRVRFFLVAQACAGIKTGPFQTLHVFLFRPWGQEVPTGPSDLGTGILRGLM